MKNLALAVALLAAVSCKRGPEPWDEARVAGNKLVAENKFSEAAEQYERSLSLKPDQDTRAYERAAFARMKAGQFDEAAALLEKGLAQHPDTKLDTYKNIAGMYLQQANDLEAAEKYFLKVREADPKDDQALTWLAEIASRRGGARLQGAAADPEQLKKAIALYDELIARIPEKPDAYVNKRVALVKYLEQLNTQKQSILTDAESQKDDKEAYADLQQQAVDTQARIDTLKGTLDETSKKLGEVMKAAKK